MVGGGVVVGTVAVCTVAGAEVVAATVVGAEVARSVLLVGGAVVRPAAADDGGFDEELHPPTDNVRPAAVTRMMTRTVTRWHPPPVW